jgi:aromatic ring-opening dioxygenase catalytic subunit (LigB family)
MAETMLCYVNWELKKDGVIILTHGQMVHEIINASHRISKRDSLQVYFDTVVAKYISFFKKFRPKLYNLGLVLSPCHFMVQSA